MNITCISILCACLAMVWLPAEARDIMPEPNWTRPAALEAAQTGAAPAILKPLFQFAREGRQSELLIALAALEDDGDLPVPAREYVLFTFAQGLADLPPGSVGSEVIDHLLGYEPRTLVPHDHHTYAGVPLFNIRAAAAGTASEWERQSAWMRSTRLLEQGAKVWLEAYLAAGTVQRRGFAEALDSATGPQLKEVGVLALEQLPASPSLTIIAARAGILLDDHLLVQQSVARGNGPDLVVALRQAASSFEDWQIKDILAHSMEQAGPVNASLAMAELGPGLMDQPDVVSLLFSTLGERELGASAALLLSASPDPGVRAHLSRLAAENQGLASRRAALAVGSKSLTSVRSER